MIKIIESRYKNLITVSVEHKNRVLKEKTFEDTRTAHDYVEWLKKLYNACNKETEYVIM